MLADLIHGVSRDVGPFMAFGAGVRLPGHFYGELMAGMAGRAGTLASVGIDPADPLIGPTRKDWEFHRAHIRVPGFESSDLHFRAVTIKARIHLGLLIGGLPDEPPFMEGLDPIDRVR